MWAFKWMRNWGRQSRIQVKSCVRLRSTAFPLPVESSTCRPDFSFEPVHETRDKNESRLRKDIPPMLVPCA